VYHFGKTTGIVYLFSFGIAIENLLAFPLVKRKSPTLAKCDTQSLLEILLTAPARRDDGSQGHQTELVIV